MDLEVALVKTILMRERFMQKDNQHSSQPEPIVTDDSTVLQPDLFTGGTAVITEPPDPQTTPFPPLVRTNPLTDQSSLSACFLPYQQDLQLRGKSEYTITCFLSDLRMFSDFIGRDTPVGRITKEHLTDWLMKLKFGKGRDSTPAPKTMARRVTFLKNFFSWLKKEEVMGLKMEHIDLSNPDMPTITVHFDAATGKQHRERRLALPAEFTTILKRYLAKYHPTSELFVCTDRNLNYVLARAVKAANIKKRVTLQLLRDTFAVQQLKTGIPPETVREKLGLSDEAWSESREKYRRLAFPK